MTKFKSATPTSFKHAVSLVGIAIRFLDIWNSVLFGIWDCVVSPRPELRPRALSSDSLFGFGSGHAGSGGPGIPKQSRPRCNNKENSLIIRKFNVQVFDVG